MITIIICILLAIPIALFMYSKWEDSTTYILILVIATIVSVILSISIACIIPSSLTVETETYQLWGDVLVGSNSIEFKYEDGTGVIAEKTVFKSNTMFFCIDKEVPAYVKVKRHIPDDSRRNKFVLNLRGYTTQYEFYIHM